MKTCFKCETKKPLCEFYRHAQMADGHLNKCKECAKADVRENAKKPHVKVRDRKRNKLPHRIAARADYQRNHRKESNARNQVYEALKSKKLIKPSSCSICNMTCDPDGHHDDYSKPLAVRWLCRSCHQLHHANEEK